MCGFLTLCCLLSAWECKDCGDGVNACPHESMLVDASSEMSVCILRIHTNSTYICVQEHLLLPSLHRKYSVPLPAGESNDGGEDKTVPEVSKMSMVDVEKSQPATLSLVRACTNIGVRVFVFVRACCGACACACACVHQTEKVCVQMRA